MRRPVRSMRLDFRLPSFFALFCSATLAAALLVAGCAPKQDAAPAKSAPAAGAHASGDVVPGSHEDWCGEHQVPESQCTRCNAALVPAFKATGDWCDAHGLPKSQCLACDPSLKIVRPPKEGAGS